MRSQQKNLILSLVVALLGASTGCSSSPGSSTSDGAAPPAVVIFRLENMAPSTIYLKRPCVLLFQVKADDTGEIHRQEDFCGSCKCSESTCTAMGECGVCFQPFFVSIAAASLFDVSWVAQAHGWNTKTGTSGPFMCVVSHDLTPGNYTFSIGVYTTSSDAVSGSDASVRYQHFQFTGGDAVVHVPIQ